MKWEYLYTYFDLSEGLYTNYIEYLNMYGKEGWELVCIIGKYTVFKRPKHD